MPTCWLLKNLSEKFGGFFLPPTPQKKSYVRKKADSIPAYFKKSNGFQVDQVLVL